MILFERNKPKSLIIWSTIFLFTQILGYIAFGIYVLLHNKKKLSLLVKEKEDYIYTTLVSNKLNVKNVNVSDDSLEFNQMVYSAKSTLNNSYEFFNNYEKFKENLIKELKTATDYIFIELNKFDSLDFEAIKSVLINKAKDGLTVRISMESGLNRKLKKELRDAGVKVYKFSKIKLMDKCYSNIRNIISIDGEIVYVGNFLSKKQIKIKNEISNLFIKFKGEVVEGLDLLVRTDLAFSSNKYIEYSDKEKEKVEAEALIQCVNNSVNNNLELMLIKAICEAKKSILLQLDSFIPSDNVLSLLKYAITSNKDVKLIVSIKGNSYNNYASRAFSKDLALAGANVYLYDGYINYNSITIDNEYVLCGSYSLNKNILVNSLQNVIIIKDEKAVNYFNKLFDASINNSYRINDAKLMLKKEKIFKNLS